MRGCEAIILSMEKTRATLTLGPTLLAKVDEVAAAADRSRSWVVGYALTAFINGDAFKEMPPGVPGCPPQAAADDAAGPALRAPSDRNPSAVSDPAGSRAAGDTPRSAAGQHADGMTSHSAACKTAVNRQSQVRREREADRKRAAAETLRKNREYLFNTGKSL
jgi:hypothetical protein